MITLRIDLETYSSVDLKKCGVHKYVESPDFQIMLLGFKWGDGQVHVIDLMAGEKIPQHLLAALDDPKILKTAYNAAFELACAFKARFPRTKIKLLEGPIRLKDHQCKSLNDLGISSVSSGLVEKIELSEKGFLLTTPEKKWECTHVVCATGARAHSPATGAVDPPRSLGHFLAGLLDVLGDQIGRAHV